MAFASSRRFATEALRVAGPDFSELATKGLASVTLICLGAGGKAIYDHYGDVRQDIKGLQEEQASLSKATALSLQQLASEQKRIGDEVVRQGKVLDSIHSLFMKKGPK